MTIVFLTFGRLSMCPGHLARFAFTLPYIAHSCTTTVVCLGPEADDPQTRARFPDVAFRHLPIRIDGWVVRNVRSVVRDICSIASDVRADIVVMQMEVWDLLRALPGRLPCHFATVVHAMPFLGSPVAPSSFTSDVQALCSSDVADYRRHYIQAHAYEAESVLRSTNVVANNRTVATLLHHYFPDCAHWAMSPSAVVETLPPRPAGLRHEFDFAYMARMERGKGIEYLADVLARTSTILGRPLRVAVLGRAEDLASRVALEDLMKGGPPDGFRVCFFGWCDRTTKRSVLAQSAAFLYPSWLDNYPTVLNEALAAGLPAVTWDVPYFRLNYSATESVMAASLGDCDAFAGLAATIFTHHERLSRRAQQFIEALPNAAETAASDMALFRSVIDKG